MIEYTELNSFHLGMKSMAFPGLAAQITEPTTEQETLALLSPSDHKQRLVQLSPHSPTKVQTCALGEH